MTLNRSTPLKAKTPLKRTALKSGGEISRKRPSNLKAKKKPKKPTSTQYKLWCDTLFSLCVRAQGPCRAQGWRPPLDEEAILDLLDLPLWLVQDRIEELRRNNCLGNTQCAHIISRGYLGTRWDFENAVVLCAGDHVYFTHHPEEWRLWVDLTFGVGYYNTIRRRALGFIARQEKPDYPATLARLVERAEELEVPVEKFRKHLPSVT